MKKCAIDLTWVRHNKVGGTESCVRNLLDGFLLNQKAFKLVLLVTSDNIKTFMKYNSDPRFEICECKTISENQKKRVIWQNIKLGKLLRAKKIYTCLEPIYSKPFFGTRGIIFYTTIHDLQAKYYPEYFSRPRVIWMKLSWWWSVHTSEKVIAISEFVRNDILKTYHINKDRVVMIPDSVFVDKTELASLEYLKNYGLKQKKFYYTVSSLLPHKNLITLISALGNLKRKHSKAFLPLVISGIGGKARKELHMIANKENLSQDIIITGFVSDAERNLMYKECAVFLFPSIFEGFGMPPVEAMLFGTPVLTTRETSIPEVSGYLLNYVDEARNPAAWCEKLESKLGMPSAEDIKVLLEKYSPINVADRYLDLLGSNM